MNREKERDLRLSLIAITIACHRYDRTMSPGEIAKKCLESIEKAELILGKEQIWP